MGVVGVLDEHAPGRSPEDIRRYMPGDDLFTPHLRARGLPIGNLTSQLAANIYLDPIDHLVTSRLGHGRYLRYMDDMVVCDADVGRLREARAAIEEALLGLRLRLNTGKSRVHRLDEGIPFLGFVHRPGSARLAPTAVRRRRRALTRMRAEFAAGRLGVADILASCRAWEAHAAHGHTRGLVRAVAAGTKFVRAAPRRLSCSASVSRRTCDSVRS